MSKIVAVFCATWILRSPRSVELGDIDRLMVKVTGREGQVAALEAKLEAMTGRINSLQAAIGGLKKAARNDVDPAIMAIISQLGNQHGIQSELEGERVP